MFFNELPVPRISKNNNTYEIYLNKLRSQCGIVTVLTSFPGFGKLILFCLFENREERLQMNSV